MHTKTRDTRRSFTVEVKSGERGGTIIPSRIAPLAKPTPQLFLPKKLEVPPAVEKRRILPNLVTPEPVSTEPEPAAGAVPADPPRRRGRPRKVPPVQAEPVGIVDEAPPATLSPTDAAPPVTPAWAGPRAPTARRGEELAPGERWKRRLGRWSR